MVVDRPRVLLAPAGWRSRLPIDILDWGIGPPFGGVEADSGDGHPTFAKDGALEVVVGEVRRAVRDAGPVAPDGAYERVHPLHLVVECSCGVPSAGSG